NGRLCDRINLPALLKATSLIRRIRFLGARLVLLRQQLTRLVELHTLVTTVLQHSEVTRNDVLLRRLEGAAVRDKRVERRRVLAHDFRDFQAAIVQHRDFALVHGKPSGRPVSLAWLRRLKQSLNSVDVAVPQWTDRPVTR